jgi:hypothetical protein
MARLGLGRTAPHRKGRLDELWDRLRAYRSRPVGSLLHRTVRRAYCVCFPASYSMCSSMTFWRLQKQEIERLRQRENCYSIPGFVSSGLGGKAGDPRWHLRYLRR